MSKPCSRFNPRHRNKRKSCLQFLNFFAKYSNSSWSWKTNSLLIWEKGSSNWERRTRKRQIHFSEDTRIYSCRHRHHYHRRRHRQSFISNFKHHHHYRLQPLKTHTCTASRMIMRVVCTPFTNLFLEVTKVSECSSIRRAHLLSIGRTTCFTDAIASLWRVGRGSAVIQTAYVVTWIRI